MNLKRLGIALFAATSALTVVPSTAQADECTDSLSYIQLPNGARKRCINLRYLTTLGAIRQNMKDVNEEYLQMMRLNSGATSITNTVSNDSGYYSNTRRYEPTPEERRAIQQAQAAVSEKHSQTAAFTEKAEQLIFRRQTQVLNQLSGVLAERRY